MQDPLTLTLIPLEYQRERGPENFFSLPFRRVLLLLLLLAASRRPRGLTPDAYFCSQ